MHFLIFNSSLRAALIIVSSFSGESPRISRIIFWFSDLVTEELFRVIFLLIKLSSMSCKFTQGIPSLLFIFLVYQESRLLKINFLLFLSRPWDVGLTVNQFLDLKKVLGLSVFLKSISLCAFFSIAQRLEQKWANQNLVEFSIEWEIIQKHIIELNQEQIMRQQIFIVLIVNILMIKQKSVDRIHEKYMAQKSKLLLKQQEQEMKKYIKQSKIRKQMRKPIDALKDMEYEHYDLKRKQLQEKKLNILHSFNYKQKQIQVLLTENREIRESKEKKQKDNNYFQILRNRIKNYP